MIAILIGYFMAALTLGYLGRHRKMGFWGYFFGSIVLTPIIGTLLVLASDPQKKSLVKV